jgi:hypothetical protein
MLSKFRLALLITAASLGAVTAASAQTNPVPPFMFGTNGLIEGGPYSTVQSRMRYSGSTQGIRGNVRTAVKQLSVLRS